MFFVLSCSVWAHRGSGGLNTALDATLSYSKDIKESHGPNQYFYERVFSHFTATVKFVSRKDKMASDLQHSPEVWILIKANPNPN